MPTAMVSVDLKIPASLPPPPPFFLPLRAKRGAPLQTPGLRRWPVKPPTKRHIQKRRPLWRMISFRLPPRSPASLDASRISPPGSRAPTHHFGVCGGLAEPDEVWGARQGPSQRPPPPPLNLGQKSWTWQCEALWSCTMQGSGVVVSHFWIWRYGFVENMFVR